MPVLLLAGAIGAGKTSAGRYASGLAGLPLIRVRDALTAVTGAAPGDRASMQDRAAEIDYATDGQWLTEFLLDRILDPPGAIVDSIRTRRQAAAVRAAFPGSQLVFIEAPEDVRRDRFNLGQASDPMKAATTFEQAMAHPTELEALMLISGADAVIDAAALTVEDVGSRLVALV